MLAHVVREILRQLLAGGLHNSHSPHRLNSRHHAHSVATKGVLQSLTEVGSDAVALELRITVVQNSHGHILRVLHSVEELVKIADVVTGHVES